MAAARLSAGSGELTDTVASAVNRPPVMPEMSSRLSVPPDGLRAGDVVLRFPTLGDVDSILPAFTDPELREAGNLPAFGREELIASLEDLPGLAEQGRLLALAAADAETGEIVGGGSLYYLDTERGSSRSATSSYPPRAGVARTTIARLLAHTRSPSASSASPPT